MDARTLQPVRGMNDVLAEDMPYWQFLEQAARDLLGAYGYQEVRVPLVEHTELFKRSIGELQTSSRRRCTPSPTVAATA